MKVVIIVIVVFGVKVVVGDVYYEGIGVIIVVEIVIVCWFGYVVKLFVIVERDNGEISVRVYFVMVLFDYLLVIVCDSFNVVFVEGCFVDLLMFYGRGVGGVLMVSVVFGDVVDAVLNF